MSTNLEKQSSGGYAFEVEVEDLGCKSPSSGKPKHVFERLGESVELSPEDIEQKLKNAEERRKIQESDKVKKVQEHNARVERISKEGTKEDK